MKTVGMILKTARISKHRTIEEVERSTKIRKKFLDAIESDDFSKIPSMAYAKGFIKNYSEYLELDHEYVLAFFRRQTMETPKSSLLPKGMADPLNTSLFRLTPARFLGMVIMTLLLVFLIYFGLQYRRIQQAPPLTIESPLNNSLITDTRVDILGKTDPDSTVTVNGISVLVREDGKFFDQVSLDAGLNSITIIATSRFGKSVQIRRDVTVTE